MPRSQINHRSQSEIHSILSDFNSSGLSQRQFAVSRGIASSTLCGWIRKKNPQITPKQARVIPLGTFSAPPVPLEIELATGEIIRLSLGFNPEDLRVVLAELRRC